MPSIAAQLLTQVPTNAASDAVARADYRAAAAVLTREALLRSLDIAANPDLPTHSVMPGRAGVLAFFFEILLASSRGILLDASSPFPK